MISNFIKPNLTVHYTDFDCSGSESKITDCTYTSLSLQEGKDLLPNTNVAGVTCNMCRVTAPPTMANSDCTEGSVRLTGGKNGEQAEGNLDYCLKGMWSNFCYLGANEAIVACRQLGFGGNDGELHKYLQCIVHTNTMQWRLYLLMDDLVMAQLSVIFKTSPAQWGQLQH